TEPQAVFSECFAAPFLPLPPVHYARMLGEKLEKHNATCYLVNTGWNGGAYGTGNRIKLEYTRAIVDAILNGKLDDADVAEDPVFGLQVPTAVPDVPDNVLQPRNTWPDASAYDAEAAKLAAAFRENFARFQGIPD